MLSYICLSSCVYILIGFLSIVETVPWGNPAQELLDEINDAEIYNAVKTSMDEWQRKQALKKRHWRQKREEESVCYRDLGCFEASGPFGYLDMLPSTPEEISTRFMLYPGHRSRRSGSAHAEIPFGNFSDAFSWAQQGFNTSLPTKVLIHGFGSDCTHIWVYELRSALMATEEMNIICVDWARGAELPNYVKAAANTRLVGKQLSILIKGLIENTGLSPRTMHLIGFSLGAHVAGFAGAELGNLSRITGLDPAGPLFESQDPRARLDQNDADFVDVIHSNGENLILGGLGSWQPMGHVDFYPNGGRMQKGCTNLFLGAVSDIIWSSAVEGRSLCNHRRAYKFFTDSVSPRCHFPAFPCKSYETFLDGKCFPCSDEKKCGNMGYYADRSKGRGQLYLITRDEEPFCAHQYHVQIESTPSDKPTVSYGKIQITLIGDSTLNESFVMTRKDDDEMKLGGSISRILVPHPILAEPSAIQIVYNAYSGWLSSGLTQWKVDKITLSDSFGKSSSVCKKGLTLESGVPVVLPLYPGDCNIPGDNGSAQDRVSEPKGNSTHKFMDDSVEKSRFIPTPVVKIGDEAIRKEYDKTNKNSFKEGFENFKPWQPFVEERDNTLDGEKESSRALNTRTIRKSKKDSDNDSSETIREVVEPILKPHSSKNGRSHDPNKEKPEISEPILGPTTSRNTVIVHTSSTLKDTDEDREIPYKFYESDNDWVPTMNLNNQGKREDKWKRQDDSKSLFDDSIIEPSPSTSNDDNPFNILTMTVQFLPQRVARMFEEAEKYARETILPFISAHTPKIIRDFIAPEEKPKYLPLTYEETTEALIPSTSKKIPIEEEANIKSRSLNTQDNSKKIKETTMQPQKITTTPYTHIQKIKKRNEKVALVFPESTTENFEFAESRDVSRRSARIETNLPKAEKLVSPKDSTSDESKISSNIYINLPVFDENYDSTKYIPLNFSNEKQR